MSAGASDDGAGTPRETGVQARHQAELDAGRFLIQRCAGCGRHVYFPREGCPHCGGTTLAWVAPSGLGTVHAVTTVRRKPAEGGDLGVCLVDLDEGVRLMSRVTSRPPDGVHIGLRVQARVQVAEGRGLVVFDAVEDGGSSTRSAASGTSAAPSETAASATSAGRTTPALAPSAGAPR